VNDLILTQEMFEASKALAPAICRGRASLYFDGYGIRKYLSIRGASNAGKSPYMVLRIDIEFKKTTYQYPLHEYMGLSWSDIRELISILDDEPAWITLNNNKKVTPCP